MSTRTVPRFAFVPGGGAAIEQTLDRCGALASALERAASNQASDNPSLKTTMVAARVIFGIIHYDSH